MKATHLVVIFAAGARRSSDDVSMQDQPHTLRINQSSLLTSPAVKHKAEQIANARRRAAEGSLTPYTFPPLAIHRHCPVKIVSLGPPNSRCQRSLKQALLADFLQFREGITHCTSPNPSKHGFSPVHSASMIARTLSFQATARLLSLPLMRYFCSELILQFEALLIGKQADVAATASLQNKAPPANLARLPHSAASSPLPVLRSLLLLSPGNSVVVLLLRPPSPYWTCLLALRRLRHSHHRNRAHTPSSFSYCLCRL